MRWLDELHTLAAQFGGFIMSTAPLGVMLGQALWFYLFVFGLTVGRTK